MKSDGSIQEDDILENTDELTMTIEDHKANEAQIISSLLSSLSSELS